MLFVSFQPYPKRRNGEHTLGQSLRIKFPNTQTCAAARSEPQGCDGVLAPAPNLKWVSGSSHKRFPRFERAAPSLRARICRRGSAELRGGTEQVHGAAPALLTRIPEGQSHRANKKNFLLLTKNKNKVTWRGANNTHTHSIRSPGNYSERPPEHQKIGPGSNNSPGQIESTLARSRLPPESHQPLPNTHVLEFGHK